MAMSNAERQKRYRQKHPKSEQDCVQVNLTLDFKVALKLKRLAALHQVSQAEVVRQLLHAAEVAELARMSSEEQETYFDSVTIG